MSEAKISPIPWQTDGDGIRMIIRANDVVIVAARHRLPADTHVENFRLIVRAVNNHEALLGAIDKALDALDNEYASEPYEDAAKILRATLSAARRESEPLS